MNGKISVSSIIFILIFIIVCYAGIKLFVWKEPLGIAAIDKLFTKNSANAIIGRWQKNNDASFKIVFNSSGQWLSSTGSGTYSFINSKCVELINTASPNFTTTTYLSIQSISENSFIASVCNSSCNDCISPPEQYIKVPYEEKKILKDFAPDHAL
jgi:hypothetical protein